VIRKINRLIRGNEFPENWPITETRSVSVHTHTIIHLNFVIKMMIIESRFVLKWNSCPFINPDRVPNPCQG